MECPLWLWRPSLSRHHGDLLEGRRTKGGVLGKAESWVVGPAVGRQVACVAADQALAGGTAGSLTASVVAGIGPRGAAGRPGKSEQRREGSQGLPGCLGRSLGLLAAEDRWQLAWCSCSGWLDALTLP